MQVKLIENKEQSTEEVCLEIRLTKKQLGVLQDALDYSAWQFVEAASDKEESIQFLYELHDEIEEQTGVKADL